MSLLRGDAIRARRRALGLSQRRLGELCGLNGTTVHRIETEPGAGKYLRLNHLENLALTLEVPPAWLLTTPDDTAAPAGTDTLTDRQSAGDTNGDARALGALLIGQGPTATQALAVSLGWRLDRLHRALTDLGQHLHTAGAALRQQNDTIQIVAGPVRASDRALVRISRLRLGVRPLNREELRTFNEIRQPGIAAKRLDWLLRQQAAQRLVHAGLLKADFRPGGGSPLGDDVVTSQRVIAEHSDSRAGRHAEEAVLDQDSLAPSADHRATAPPVLVHPIVVPPPTEIDWRAIRQWARDNGYPVGDHGGIRADILAAYYRGGPQSSTTMPLTTPVDPSPSERPHTSSGWAQQRP